MDATDPQSQQNVVITESKSVYLDKDLLHTCGGKQTVIPPYMCIIIIQSRVRAM